MFVLLDERGAVVDEFDIVAMPANFVVPSGMILGWKVQFMSSSRDFKEIEEITEERVPVLSFFYLGKAVGQVQVEKLSTSNVDSDRRLTIVVQGTDANDVMELRERILEAVHCGISWRVTNYFDPTKRRE